MITKDYRDVLAAAREIVAKAPAEPDSLSTSGGWWRSWELGAAVASQLGIHDDYRDSFHGSNYDEHNRKRLDGQARRAFDALAAEGLLVKTGRGERTPSGSVLGSEAQYHTPAAHLLAVQAAADKAEADRIEAERWAGIYDTLAVEGFGEHILPVHNVTRSQARGSEITLDLEGWARLLSCLPFDAMAVSPAAAQWLREKQGVITDG